MLLVAVATVVELKAALSFGYDLRGTHAGVAQLKKGGAGPDVLVLLTGVGPVSAACCIGRALAEHRVSGVLNLGVAGVFGEGLPLGAIAVVEEECMAEFGLWTPQGLEPQGLGFAQAELDGRKIFDRLELNPAEALASMDLAVPEEWARTRALTVAGVSGTPERAAMLESRYGEGSRPLLENMEGFGLALGCARAGVPFAQVRVVSNRVGVRPPEGWDLSGALDGLGRAAARLLGSR